MAFSDQMDHGPSNGHHHHLPDDKHSEQNCCADNLTITSGDNPGDNPDHKNHLLSSSLSSIGGGLVERMGGLVLGMTGSRESVDDYHNPNRRRRSIFADLGEQDVFDINFDDYWEGSKSSILREIASNATNRNRNCSLDDERMSMSSSECMSGGDSLGRLYSDPIDIFSRFDNRHYRVPPNSLLSEGDFSELEKSMNVESSMREESTVWECTSPIEIDQQRRRSSSCPDEFNKHRYQTSHPMYITDPMSPHDDNCIQQGFNSSCVKTDHQSIFNNNNNCNRHRTSLNNNPQRGGSDILYDNVFNAMTNLRHAYSRSSLRRRKSKAVKFQLGDPTVVSAATGDGYDSDESFHSSFSDSIQLNDVDMCSYYSSEDEEYPLSNCGLYGKQTTSSESLFFDPVEIEPPSGEKYNDKGGSVARVINNNDKHSSYPNLRDATTRGSIPLNTTTVRRVMTPPPVPSSYSRHVWPSSQTSTMPNNNSHRSQSSPLTIMSVEGERKSSSQDDNSSNVIPVLSLFQQPIDFWKFEVD